MVTQRIAQRLRQARKGRRWSLNDLAERTGGILSKSPISNDEQGIRRPGNEEAIMLAQALGAISPTWLLCLDEAPSPLNEREEALIRAYRIADARGQWLIMDMAKVQALFEAQEPEWSWSWVDCEPDRWSPARSEPGDSDSGANDAPLAPPPGTPLHTSTQRSRRGACPSPALHRSTHRRLVHDLGCGGPGRRWQGGRRSRADSEVRPPPSRQQAQHTMRLNLIACSVQTDAVERRHRLLAQRSS